MNKQQFKKAYSKYRAILSGRYEERLTGMGTDLNEVFFKCFNNKFGVSHDRRAFVNAGCSYSFQFEWIFGKRGSHRAEQVVARNQHVINWGS